MAQQWHYAKGKQKHGPISSKQLKALAANGELEPTDLIFRDGMKGWKEARTVKGLFPQAMTPKVPARSEVPPPVPSAISEEPPTIPPSLKGPEAHSESAGLGLGQFIPDNVFTFLSDWRVTTGLVICFFLVGSSIDNIYMPLMFVAACLLYYDASGNRIGSVANDDAQFPNISAGLWAIGCIVWPVVLPFYFFKRPRLVTQAQASPQIPSARWLKLAILGFLAVIIPIGSYGVAKQQQEASHRLHEANKLWDNGSQDEAVAKYKTLIDDSIGFIDRSNRPTVYQRIIDFEAEHGHHNSAKQMIEKALNVDVPLSLTVAKAKELLAQVKTEIAARAKATADAERVARDKAQADAKRIARDKAISPSGLVADDAKFLIEEFGARYVTGTIVNNSGRNYSHVHLEINLYDRDGSQVGSTVDFALNVEAGAKWKFKAIVAETSAVDFKVKKITAY